VDIDYPENRRKNDDGEDVDVQKNNLSNDRKAENMKSEKREVSKKPENTPENGDDNRRPKSGRSL
jgi:hypothetical protein